MLLCRYSVTPPALLTSIDIRNFKSIRRANVTLERLNILVGPNGAGKSNFLDALHFISEAILTTPELAVTKRGGLLQILPISFDADPYKRLHRKFEDDDCPRFTTKWLLEDGSKVTYEFLMAVMRPPTRFIIQREKCHIETPDGQNVVFRVEEGRVVEGVGSLLGRIGRDRLYLATASAVPAFRPVFDAIAGMRFYDFHLGKIADPQPPDSGDFLLPDGSNLASVIKRMADSDPEGLERIIEYMQAINPSIASVRAIPIAKRRTLSFSLRQPGGPNQGQPRVNADYMSAGTLRSLAILTALFQNRNAPEKSGFIGIEEPEVAIHPGATAVLADAFFEASHFTQIVASSHSPDLLDSPRLTPESILAVSMENTGSAIRPMSESTKEAIRERLYSMGELMRVGHLTSEM